MSEPPEKSGECVLKATTCSRSIWLDRYESPEARRAVQDTEQFARRRPALFFGGAVLAGLAVGRFFKSASPGASATSKTH